MTQQSLFMRVCRQTAWLLCCCAIMAASVSCVTHADSGPPPVETLQSGDFIWPKKPDAIIPYALPEGTRAMDQTVWETERDAYIESLMSSQSLTEDEKRRIELLGTMSYESFMRIYMEDVPSDEEMARGVSAGVGHVAIVRKVDGEPATIVEALWDIGVREIPYEQWKAERERQIFWHGRLGNLHPARRAAVARLASREVGKPYDFWNFNLEDDTGFYCSKLAWLMIRNATGLVVDDNPDPQRILWYSPKQLLKSPHIKLLQNPGGYGLPSVRTE